jgi:hypothetical protein
MSKVTLHAASDEDFIALIAGTAPVGFDIADGGIETPETLTMLHGLAQSVQAQWTTAPVQPTAWMIVYHDQVWDYVRCFMRRMSWGQSL